MVIWKERSRGDVTVPKDATYPCCSAKYQLDESSSKLVDDQDITEMISWFYVVLYAAYKS